MQDLDKAALGLTSWLTYTLSNYSALLLRNQVPTLQTIKYLPHTPYSNMLSRHLQSATRGVSRSALFSTSSVRALGKVPAPAMDTPENKPDSLSNSNAKPDSFKPEGQAPGDKTSDAELKRQAEYAGQVKTKNDGIYKRSGQ